MNEQVAVFASPPPTTRADKEFEAKIDTNRFRRARMRMVIEALERLAPGRSVIRLLDVGGSRAYWEGARDLWGHLPLEITIVNLGAPTVDDPPYYLRSGNACGMQEYPDNSFDFVHSNSVIEHVGKWADMMAMAREVRRLARHYYVQTPNFGFPYEPHYRTLFFHWYPEVVRARMLMRKKRGFRGPLPTLDRGMRDIQTVNLLNRSQMAELFGDARIETERVFGLAKSLIAIR